jgi:tetratricopeptide (TPR) repeat protein
MSAVIALAGKPSPRIFISYAHDNEAHRAAVRQLRDVLVSLGFTVIFDLDVTGPVNWPEWQERSIDEADFVLVIASPQYRVRALGDGPVDVGRGVYAEARKLSALIYADKGTASLRKILAVVLPGGSPADLPYFFAPPATAYFAIEEISPAGLRSLLRVLRGEVTVSPDGAGVRQLRRTVTLDVSVRGRFVHTRLSVGETAFGEHRADLPVGIERAFAPLDAASAATDPTAVVEALREAGRRLAAVLLSAEMARRLEVVLASAGIGEPVDVEVVCGGDALVLPYELLVLPDGRVLSTVPGVRMRRRLADVTGPPSAMPPGPLRILAAVAAPTTTSSPPLDVEREMQAIIDAVADLGTAEVTILEVASLGQIADALRRDSYHVLHLSAHGSSSTVELEDEDGNAVTVGAADLVRVLQHAGQRVPLIVLSSCEGAAGGDAGLAATLLRHGADRVLAMQARISDDYATRLMGEVYRELAAANTPVSQALAYARCALATVSGPASPGGSALSGGSASSGALAARPEYGVATLFVAAGDPPLCGPGDPVHLSRRVEPPSGQRVRELRLGDLIGRRRELRSALAALRHERRFVEAHGATRGVVLTGIGGIGKTALAGRIIARLKEETADPWTVVVHEGELNLQSLVDSVARDVPELAEPFAQLADEQKLPALRALLEGTRLLLVLDDFERNLTTGGDEFREPSTAALFADLVRHAGGRSRLLVTCRYPVPGDDDLHRVEVPPLSPAELRRMLLRMPMLRDLPVEDRRLIVTTIGGHPRLIEFVDALLRGRRGRGLLHSVSEKLRALAAAEGVPLARSPREAPTLSDATRQALILGSRDILLEELLALLTPRQREVLLQAAVSRVPMSIDDLGSALDPPGDVREEADRLIDLTLLSTVDGGATDDVVVHMWVAEALAPHQGDQEPARQARALDMRYRRIREDRETFDDYAECVRHLCVLGRFPELASFALAVSRYVGQLGTAELCAYARALLPEEHPLWAAFLSIEVEAATASGQPNRARALAERLFALTSVRASMSPDDLRIQHELLVSCGRLGDLAVAAGDAAAARDWYTQGLQIRRRLVEVDPGNVQFQRDLSVSYERLGDLAVAAGDAAAARDWYTQGLQIAQRLVEVDPGNVQFQRDLSISYNKLGDLAVAAGDAAAARDWYTQVLEIARRLVEVDPGNVQFQRDLAISYGRLASLVSASDPADARRLCQAARDIVQRLVEIDPSNPIYSRDLRYYEALLAGLAPDDASSGG